ncbi:MAG TPA: excinuclease ATPase subunit [Burkholderiaceae bacterium]
MKKLVVVPLLVLIAAAPAFARNNAVTVTLDSVLDMPEAKAKLDGSVKFYLAGAPTPKIIKKFGEDTSNAKTNAFNKTPEEACRWNALSALLKLQEHAKRDGANAVVDIVSYRDHVDFKSATEIECSDGAFLGGIALKGTYATVGK